MRPTLARRGDDSLERHLLEVRGWLKGQCLSEAGGYSQKRRNGIGVSGVKLQTLFN